MAWYWPPGGYDYHYASLINSPYDRSINIGTRTNGLLIVALRLDTTVLTGVSYNSVALTKATEHSADNNLTFWYLANPSDGNNTLRLTFTTQSGQVRMITAWFDGVDTADPLHLGSQESEAATGDPTITVTTTEDNALVVCGEQNWRNEDPTIVTGNELASVYEVGFGFAASYAVKASAGGQTLDWDLVTETETWRMWGAAFSEAAETGLQINLSKEADYVQVVTP